MQRVRMIVRDGYQASSGIRQRMGQAAQGTVHSLRIRSHSPLQPGFQRRESRVCDLRDFPLERIRPPSSRSKPHAGISVTSRLSALSVHYLAVHKLYTIHKNTTQVVFSVSESRRQPSVLDVRHILESSELIFDLYFKAFDLVLWKGLGQIQ